jgi:acyl transferase domain-containing protein/acyl carrier protein
MNHVAARPAFATPAAVPLAIVGVGALFPGSAETGDLWRNIVRGVDLLGDVPPQYWLTGDYYDADPLASLKTYANRGGFLPKVPFDSLGHGIPPANVPTTDSTQLLALIVAKRVLEDACGLDLKRLDRGRTSVILGVAGGTTLLGSMCSSLQRPIWTKALRESGLPEDQVQAICAAIEASYTPWTESTFPGLLGNVIAGRVASRFDLGGTNCVVDAACASSLAALRMAAQELRLGTADLVVTGGVDATNDPLMFTCFSKTPALSRSGDCRPFSADSDGTMLGEGVGMFAMRRLDDAERDGDAIYAVIRGMGSSSDGRAKSIYAPRAEGQMKALRRAYEEAGYTPAAVELVEAHGTGTAAGDKAEIAALKDVFAEAGGDARHWCALGSVKSQIGHTKSAAGAASLYKVVMALHHKVLPPTLKISQPNPELGLADSAFELGGAARPWIRDGQAPRRAAVSSFGFGGSNYHVTVEEYRGAARPPRVRAMPSELVLASGPDAATALAVARRVTMAPPAGFAAAARNSQRAFDRTALVRMAFVARDAAELAGQIDAAAPRLASGAVRLPGVVAAMAPAAPGPIGFLFPGQGSQYTGMGADLAMAFDAARAVWDDAVADPAPGYGTLHRLTFPATAYSDAARAEQAAALTATEVAQPAIGVTSQMMLALLSAAGVRPAAVAGHSYGELSALHAAGVLDGDGFRTASRRRGALMAEAARVTEGAMLAVFRPAAEVEALLAREGAADVVIANRNGPEQVVLAGPVRGIAAMEAQLAALGLGHKRLPVATAFHSPIVAPAAGPFRAVLEGVGVRPPAVPVYACATAAPYPADAVAIRDQLARQLTQPVLFTAQIEAMHAAGVTTFLEVGPGNTLTELAGRILAGKPHLAVAMDRRGRDGVAQLWEALGALAVAGHAVDFDFAWAGYPLDAPAEEKRSAATLMIDGATYRRPYPPVDGSAALPPPNVAAPVMPEAPAMQTSTPEGVATPAPLAAILAALRASVEAQAAALAQVQALVGHLAGDPVVPAASVIPVQAAVPAVTAPPSAPPVPMAAAPDPEPAAASSPLVSMLLGIVAEKTGYPVEMLSPEMELEADLGIDSIKRVEILAAFRAAAPGLPEVDPRELGGLRTLAAILERLGGAAAAPLAPMPASAAAIPAPIAAPSGVPDALAETLLAIVAEKTGYPVEMLNPAMELEADLGIDSIKRVEILAAFRAAAPGLPEVDPRDLAGLRTLSAILERLGGAVAPEAAPAPVAPVVMSAPEAPAGASPALAETLLTIVADKTGYPVEMLNPAMELEADLGVDSIKRVEILAAFRAAAPGLPEVDPRDLAGLRTLSAILDRLGGAAVPPEAPQAPEPLAVAGAAVPPLPAASDPGLEPVLLGIVADKTGYPVEMLNPAMELEADLGIDSIKRVEILAAFRAAAPGLPEVDPRDLAGLRTLSAILDRLGGAVAAQAVPIASLPRIGLMEVAAGPCSVPPALVAGMAVAVVGDGAGLTLPLTGALLAAGFAPLPGDRVGEADAVIVLLGLEEAADAAAVARMHLEAFGAARAFAPRATTRGGTFVTVQDTGGCFGLSGSADGAWLGGLAGIAKTAAAEWPLATVHAVDLERGAQTLAQQADRLVEELQCGGMDREVGLRADGRRITLAEVPLAQPDRGRPLPPRPVLVVSGGGRGVVASCLLALAPHLRPRLLLLGRTALRPEPPGLPLEGTAAQLSRALYVLAVGQGRTPSPRELSAEASQIVATRDIRATVAALAAAGAEVRYRSVDVADRDALDGALAEVRRDWGGIDGVVHGAGVLADKLIAEQTDDQFLRVFRTKVDGLRALLDATRGDGLSVLCLFSSVAGRYGNPGQVAYAAANEVLNKVARAEAARRGAACRVVSLNWGPWDGGMVSDGLREAFARRGVPLIAVEDGAQAFVAEMLGGGATEVVLGGRLVAATAVPVA